MLTQVTGIINVLIMSKINQRFSYFLKKISLRLQIGDAIINKHLITISLKKKNSELMKAVKFNFLIKMFFM